MILSDDECYRALSARDERFDGRFFACVLTTGIYCRPVCPSRTPQRSNVKFLGSAVAASAAGFRACRRCRPDSLPASRDWDHRGDLVARALRMISAGTGDAGGTTALAQSLAVTPRHLNRMLVAEVGATAGQLTRSRRAQVARLLLADSDLNLADVAFAAGFGSVRQFNDSIRAHFGSTPSRLRSGAPPTTPAATLTLRLRLLPPYATTEVLGWLARHGVPGVDTVTDSTVTTTTTWGATVRAQFAGGDEVAVTLGLPPTRDVRVVPDLIEGIRRWLDLSVNPAQVDGDLAAQPVLRPLVRRRPGMRVLGHPDPFFGLVRTILGQQVSVAAAGTHSARLAGHLADGTRLPAAAELAAADPAALAAAVGIPQARGRTLVTVAEEVASGRISLAPAADRSETLARLGQISGIGPWTLAEVRMRCLGDPDAWPAGDLVLRRALERNLAGLDPAAVAPWRSYLAHHVWIDEAVRRRQAA